MDVRWDAYSLYRDWVRWPAKRVVHVLQRAFRGFDDTATWSVDWYFTDHMAKVLRRFKELMPYSDTDWEAHKGFGDDVEAELDWAIRYLEGYDRRQEIVQDIQMEVMRRIRDSGRNYTKEDLDNDPRLKRMAARESRNNDRLVRAFSKFWT